VFHRSERLLLRPAWPEDWQGVFAGIADQAIVRNLASAPWPYADEDARQFVSRPFDPVYPGFLVTRAEDATVVGCIGVSGPDAGEGAMELGYWIARPHWGRGYATEAGGAMLQILRALGHGRIVASHFLDNPASGRVLRKLGFEPTGRMLARHSCGRGEKALVAEYALDLQEQADNPQVQAA
jgi:RimJ/RimL family protein N-acetyltransferase